jgi:hypothetical protein
VDVPKGPFLQDLESVVKHCLQGEWYVS